MFNWSELNPDVLVNIAQRIKTLDDFVAFGAVCKAWYKAGKKVCFKGWRLWQGTPYLMLPIKDDDCRELYSLVEGKIVDSIKIPSFKSKKCIESMGWLLTIEGDGSMSLINPFSSVVIPLPHQTTFPDYDDDEMDDMEEMYAYIFIDKMTLSSRPSESSNFVLMTIYGYDSHLGFWRQGNKTWNQIGTRTGYGDVMYHDGHFYAIDKRYSVLVFNFVDDQPTESQVLVPPRSEVVNDNICNRSNIYILKTSEDSLLVIIRDGESGADGITIKFNLYEVDLSTGTWNEVNSLGSMALFVGYNSTIVVKDDAASRFHGKIKNNHIYFTDDNFDSFSFNNKGYGKDMGVYNIETGTIEPLYNGELLLSNISPSIWITFEPDF